jgi:hypothetical protein
MPEIPISPEQQAYIEALRDELDDEVAYGHVREQDAVQYLIDHHREDGELDVEVREVAAAEEGNADPDDDVGEEDDPADGADGSGDENDAPAEGSTDKGGGSGATAAGGSVDASVEALGNAGPGGDGGDDAGGEAATADGATATAGESGEGTIGSAGGDMVDEMMNLMDAHSDVWEETDGSEGKYRVELPDGSTDSVPTKDDVRALLFKHYR